MFNNLSTYFQTIFTLFNELCYQNRLSEKGSNVSGSKQLAWTVSILYNTVIKYIEMQLLAM